MKLALLTAVLALPAVVHADPEPARSYVSATAGLATPVGEVGLEYTYLFTQHLELSGGVGLANMLRTRNENGDSTSINPQLAIMPRLRHPMGNAAFVIGAGLSGGTYTVQSSAFSSDDYEAITRALWLNGEVGFEWFPGGGMAVGVYGGYGTVIAHGTVHNSRNEELMSLRDDTLPYFGVRVGHVL
ncbi:MAG TPA: hypothetical protein VGM39_21290 [Kofleriaceae bacterium]